MQPALPEGLPRGRRDHQRDGHHQGPLPRRSLGNHRDAERRSISATRRTAIPSPTASTPSTSSRASSSPATRRATTRRTTSACGRTCRARWPRRGRWMCPAGVYEIPEDAPGAGQRRRDRQLHQLRAVRGDHGQGRAPDDARGRRRAAVPGHLSRRAVPNTGGCCGDSITSSLGRPRERNAPRCVSSVCVRKPHINRSGSRLRSAGGLTLTRCLGHHPGGPAPVPAMGGAQRLARRALTSSSPALPAGAQAQAPPLRASLAAARAGPRPRPPRRSWGRCPRSPGPSAWACASISSRASRPRATSPPSRRPARRAGRWPLHGAVTAASSSPSACRALTGARALPRRSALPLVRRRAGALAALGHAHDARLQAARPRPGPAHRRALDAARGPLPDSAAYALDLRNDGTRRRRASTSSSPSKARQQPPQHVAGLGPAAHRTVTSRRRAARRARRCVSIVDAEAAVEEPERGRRRRRARLPVLAEAVVFAATLD